MYKNADEAQKASLDTQKAGYYKELAKLQGAKYDKQNSATVARKDDPFYRKRDFEPQLQETGEGYVFTAHAPADDLDSVDVRVKDNKVILRSTRRFEDRNQLPGETTTTHSYQTQRHEFQLQHPVDPDAIKRERTQDGFIVVTIPKKTFSFKA